jgi:hypothetical protein
VERITHVSVTLTTIIWQLIFRDGLHKCIGIISWQGKYGRAPCQSNILNRTSLSRGRCHPESSLSRSLVCSTRAGDIGCYLNLATVTYFPPTSPPPFNLHQALTRPPKSFLITTRSVNVASTPRSLVPCQLTEETLTKVRRDSAQTISCTSTLSPERTSTHSSRHVSAASVLISWPQ